MKVLEVYDDNTIELEITEAEKDFLIEYAVNDLIRKGIEAERMMNETNICSAISNSE